MGGLLKYARDCALLTTPTINGYRRYRALSLAPDRAAWAHDNRGAMLRVLGGCGQPDTRIENRVGEPAANPYLYIGSQIIAGLAGMDAQLDPGPSADEPYQSVAPNLPRSLPEAISALQQSALLRSAFGDTFVDYFCHIKEAEYERFQQEVTAWEEREYLDLF
jgi:glutamine synthetase